ncbi:hypothetical protein [Nocardia sp. CY41]|uniref:hypothetical protein n=1 Tax=Nocardia sp. CY41 TaxID=2608686 RepID=UPI00135B5897|nr:hypothetical protein [Nocardia sp. CY41]
MGGSITEADRRNDVESLDYAIERKLLAHNVARAIKPKAGKKRKPLTYTPEEVSKLLAGLEADRDGRLWSWRGAACGGVNSAGCAGAEWISSARRS